MQKFGDVHPFLQEQTELSTTTRRKPLQILEDPVKRSRLQLELTAVIDASEPFVKATHLLEGDDPLALKCYEIVQNVATSDIIDL